MGVVLVGTSDEDAHKRFVAGRAAAHQHLRHAPMATRQDQGGGVLGLLAAARARGVGQVLSGVEGLRFHRRLPMRTPFKPPEG